MVGYKWAEGRVSGTISSFPAWLSGWRMVPLMYQEERKKRKFWTFCFEHIEWDSQVRKSETQEGGPRWKQDIHIEWAMMVKVGSGRRGEESSLENRKTKASSHPLTTHPWLRASFVLDTLESAWRGLSHFVCTILQGQTHLLYRWWNPASQKCPALISSWLWTPSPPPSTAALSDPSRHWMRRGGHCFWNHTQGTALKAGLPGIVFTYICTACK